MAFQEDQGVGLVTTTMTLTIYDSRRSITIPTRGTGGKGRWWVWWSHVVVRYMWKVPLGQRCTKSQTCGSSTAQRGLHREISNAMPAVELVALPVDKDYRMPSCWSATKRVRNKHD
jgi:hypothetical protein